MILIFTGNEQLDQDLSKKIKNSRLVYYPEYVLQEEKATILITAVQENKFKFKEFMFNVRQKNIRVILILENEKVKEIKDAMVLGIYDLVFDPFDIGEIKNKIFNPSKFSEISKYIKNILELQ